MRSRMEDDGVEGWDVEVVRARARAAEKHFITVTGARKATTAQNMGGFDCVLNGEPIDIKSIEPHHAYVLGISSPRRPEVLTAVVQANDDGTYTILGFILGFQWDRGAPVGTRECWYAIRSKIVQSPTWTSLESEWRRRTDEER
jgi:hypothetical protein